MIYNLTLVLRSTLKEGDKKKTLEVIKSSFKDSKITEKEWGQKPLAYPIKKEVSGDFVNFEIVGDNTVPFDFEKELLRNDDVLRHLLLRIK
jgi:ribosomal protein S6